MPSIAHPVPPGKAKCKPACDTPASGTKDREGAKISSELRNMYTQRSKGRNSHGKLNAETRPAHTAVHAATPDTAPRAQSLPANPTNGGKPAKLCQAVMNASLSHRHSCGPIETPRRHPPDGRYQPLGGSSDAPAIGCPSAEFTSPS